MAHNLLPQPLQTAGGRPPSTLEHPHTEAVGGVSLEFGISTNLSIFLRIRFISPALLCGEIRSPWRTRVQICGHITRPVHRLRACSLTSKSKGSEKSPRISYFSFPEFGHQKRNFADEWSSESAHVGHKSQLGKFRPYALMFGDFDRRRTFNGIRETNPPTNFRHRSILITAGVSQSTASTFRKNDFSTKLR